MTIKIHTNAQVPSITISDHSLLFILRLSSKGDPNLFLHKYSRLLLKQSEDYWEIWKQHQSLSLRLSKILSSFAAQKGFQGVAGGKQTNKRSANPPAGDTEVGSIPVLGRSPGIGDGDPLQYSCWRTPWTELGGLQFIGLKRVRHDWSDLTHKHTHSLRPNISN